jgi:hypothetical protein
MKTSQSIIVAAILLALASFTSAAPARQAPCHYVVAICTGLSSNQCQDVFKQSMNLLLNHAQVGDRVEFLAAPQGNRLASVIVPEGTARARANSREYAGKFAGLIQFLKTPATVDSRQAMQLRIPQLLDGIARSSQHQERLAVVVIGSPLYLASNEREAAFDMEKGLTPSDGIIAASVTESLFGTLERKGQLQNATVHWLTPSDDWAVGEMHRRAVTRFWTVFIGEQGATLSTFSSDIARVFERAAQGEASSVLTATLDPNDRGLIMRPPPIFRRESAPLAESRVILPPAKTPNQPVATPTNAPVVIAPPAFSPHVESPAITEAVTELRRTPPVVSCDDVSSANTPTRPVKIPTNTPVAIALPTSGPKVESPAFTKAVAEIPRAPTGHIGIAAVWEASANVASTADVDLYVAAHPGRPEVCWKRAEAADAVYYRDIRHAGPQGQGGDWTASWEYVEVKHARLEDVSVWLNMYDTKGSVKGVVRVQWNGRTVDKPFQFILNRGNKGADSSLSQRRQSAYWQEIKLRELFPEEFVSKTPAP